MKSRALSVLLSMLAGVLAFAAPTVAIGFADTGATTVVVPRNEGSPIVHTAAEMLIEEVKRLTGMDWVLSDIDPASGTVVIVSTGEDGIAAEGFRLTTGEEEGRIVVAIAGADPRGALYGVGRLLQEMRMTEGRALIPLGLDITTAPRYSIRGQQIGYRNTANSWDAWTVEQFERYIRDFVIFGANSIENIPLGGGSPHFRYTRSEMNRAMSEGVPEVRHDVSGSGFPDQTTSPIPHSTLKDSARRTVCSPRRRTSPRVFVPGGDPGDNHPRDLMPYLEELSEDPEKTPSGRGHVGITSEIQP